MVFVQIPKNQQESKQRLSGLINRIIQSDNRAELSSLPVFFIMRLL